MRTIPFLVTVLIGAADVTPAADPRPPAAKPAPSPREAAATVSSAMEAAPKGAARILVETLAVDRRGTWTIGSDEAEIFPGSDAILEKSATLIGRQQPERREMVQVTAHFTPVIRADGVCALRIDSEVRAVVSGQATGRPPADRRSAVVEIQPDKERYLEAYTSSATGARLGFKVRCAAAAGPTTSTASMPDVSAITFVDFDLDIARGQGEDPVEPLKSNRLRAILGREAENLFAFNFPLPEGDRGDKRYRREHVELNLLPEVISEGRIQVRVVLKGQVATVSGDGSTISHPFEREDTAVLSSGGAHPIDLEVVSGGNDEGWTRVRYRLLITGRF